MKTTNKYRIENYDALEAKASKLELIMYDLVNSRFSRPVKFTAAVIRERYQETWDGGSYTFRLSWRGMPLLLSEYHANRVCDASVEVWTEQEVQEEFRANPSSLYWRMAMDARNTLISEAIEKAHAGNAGVLA
jgi:hypothetical protein